MQRHVLLMLSSDQKPDPVDEVRFHDEHCRVHGLTYLVTTQVVKGLTPGVSQVAMYGNMRLANRLLATGTFHEYIPLVSPRGAKLVEQSALYRYLNRPDRAKALIALQDVRLAGDDADIASLRGIIVNSGLPLTRENIPRGHRRSQVYYYDEAHAADRAAGTLATEHGH